MESFYDWLQNRRHAFQQGLPSAANSLQQQSSAHANSTQKSPISSVTALFSDLAEQLSRLKTAPSAAIAHVAEINSRQVNASSHYPRPGSWSHRLSSAADKLSCKTVLDLNSDTHSAEFAWHVRLDSQPARFIVKLSNRRNARITFDTTVSFRDTPLMLKLAGSPQAMHAASLMVKTRHKVPLAAHTGSASGMQDVDISQGKMSRSGCCTGHCQSTTPAVTVPHNASSKAEGSLRHFCSANSTCAGLWCSSKQQQWCSLGSCDPGGLQPAADTTPVPSAPAEHLVRPAVSAQHLLCQGNTSPTEQPRAQGALKLAELRSRAAHKAKTYHHIGGTCCHTQHHKCVVDSHPQPCPCQELPVMLACAPCMPDTAVPANAASKQRAAPLRQVRGASALSQLQQRHASQSSAKEASSKFAARLAPLSNLHWEVGWNWAAGGPVASISTQSGTADSNTGGSVASMASRCAVQQLKAVYDPKGGAFTLTVAGAEWSVAVALPTTGKGWKGMLPRVMQGGCRPKVTVSLVPALGNCIP